MRNTDELEEVGTGVRARVSLEIERVVETLAAQRAQIAFNIAVTLEVPVEHAQLREDFLAHLTLVSVVLHLHN